MQLALYLKSDMINNKELFKKALNVIFSCKTLEQLDAANEYAKLTLSYFEKVLDKKSRLLYEIERVFSNYIEILYRHDALPILHYDSEWMAETVFEIGETNEEKTFGNL